MDRGAGPSAKTAVIVAAVVAGGCGTPSVPASWNAEAAVQFQNQVVADLRGPQSPLSVVASDYLGPGQRRTLGHHGRRVVAKGGEDPVTLEVEDGFRCSDGCPVLGLIETPVSFDWGPLRLSLGPQPSGDAPGGRVLVHDPEAPALQRAAQARFHPVDPAFIVAARFEVASDEPVRLATTRGLRKPMVWAGTLRFTLGGEEQTLRGYRSAGAEAGPLLVPFTDPTNGASSYPVGRYLSVEVDGAAAVLDFNRATNPWCAYSSHFNCPVPPAGNRITAAVTAGEQVFGDPP